MDEHLASLLYAIDWANTFRPASLLLLSGQSPYLNKWFFGPPWALFPLLPLAVLPETIGRLILLLLCFILFALSALRLGARPVALVAFLLSPVVLHSLSTGNLDAFVLFGAALPPWLGLFFVSIKPQRSLPLAIFGLAAAWRAGGPRQVLFTFAPISAALLLSLAIFGPWPLNVLHSGQAGTALSSRHWNASLWPMSLPVGLVLLATSLRYPEQAGQSRSRRAALAAGPPLSHYVSFQSWSASLIGLAPHTVEMVAAVCGLCVMVALTSG